VLYKDFQAGNESRILDVMDEMIRAERREDELLRTSSSRASVLVSEAFRIFLAIEFGRDDDQDAVHRLETIEATLVSMSEAEPDLGVLRRRRVEGHLRLADALAMLAERASARGDAPEAGRLAARAARAFDDLALAQEDRLRREERVSTNEDQLLAHARSGSAAMRALMDGRFNP
jgi:hypothetical protein